MNTLQVIPIMAHLDTFGKKKEIKEMTSSELPDPSKSPAEPDGRVTSLFPSDGLVSGIQH